MPSERAEDLWNGKSYLSGLRFVDQKRIGAMAWSQAGPSTLASFQRRKNPFMVVVAFYPYRFKPLVERNMRLLVLVGELDDWCPPALWQERMPLRESKREIILKVYPGAYHCFDGKGVNRNYGGHRLQYGPAAAADSILRVREFLARHLP